MLNTGRGGGFGNQSLKQRVRAQVVMPYLGGVLGKEGAQAAAKGFLDRCFEASIEKVTAALRMLHCLASRM